MTVVRSPILFTVEQIAGKKKKKKIHGFFVNI